MRLRSILVALIGAIPCIITGYLVRTDNVNCRAGPSIFHNVLRTYRINTDLAFICQTPGTSIRGVVLWDKTTDGCFISDYYMRTGSTTFVTKDCSETRPLMSTACHAPNDIGIGIIKRFEPLVLVPQRSPVSGAQGIGYGHQCRLAKCTDIAYPIPLSKETAELMLIEDLAEHAACLNQVLATNVTLNDNQWSALVSWAYNVGCVSVEQSQMVQRLNSGDRPEDIAQQELMAWVAVDGQIVQEMVRRRSAELSLFKKYSNRQAYPRCQR